MQSRATHLLAVALMCAGGAAFAQTQAEEDAPAAPEAAQSEATETETSEPEAGNAAAPANGAGQPFVAEEHGDWERRCVRAADGSEPCQLYQILLDEGGGSVAEIVVFPLPPQESAAAGAVITTPLETLLTEDIVISVDGAEGQRYPFSFCTEAGCVSRIGLTEANLEAFRKGNEAKLRIVPARAPDQQVLVTISLSGFTAGYAALSAPGN